MDLQQVHNIISQLHKDGEYRPVGVAVLYQHAEDGLQFLITQSAKSTADWAFPQGGIEAGERIDDSLVRELAEELGISKYDLADVEYAIHYECLDAETSRKDRRGFKKGKAYFFTLARYIGKGAFVLKHDEIAGAHWMSYDEAIEHFQRGRLEKAHLSGRALDKAVNILLPPAE